MRHLLDRFTTTQAILGFLTLSVVALLAQSNRSARYSPYAGEMQDPAPMPPDGDEKTEWAFARLRYPEFRGYGGGGFGAGGFGGRRGGWGRRSSWATDSNKAEQQFVLGVRRLTRLHARSSEEIVEADRDDMFDWPWLYAVEVGHWDLTDAQGKRLREYLDRGGFLMVDDFHGTREWEIFLAGLQKIVPDRPVTDIPDEDAIFHVLYDLGGRVQVPGRQYIWSRRLFEQDGVDPKWRAVYDGRSRIQVAICHNMDLGDAWEWADDPQYPENFASMAYRTGINYIAYAMTH